MSIGIEPGSKPSDSLDSQFESAYGTLRVPSSKCIHRAAPILRVIDGIGTDILPVEFVTLLDFIFNRVMHGTVTYLTVNNDVQLCRRREVEIVGSVVCYVDLCLSKEPQQPKSNE